MSENQNEVSLGQYLVLASAIAFFLILQYREKFLSSFFNHKYFTAGVIAFATSVLSGVIYNRIFPKFLKLKSEANIYSKIEGEDSVFSGLNKNGKPVYVKQSFRKMHTQVIGTTNAGKTESIIVPWAVDDIRKGKGFIIIDGKSDSGLLDKLYSYAKKYNRTEDMKILSLCNVDISNSFNPLVGSTPLEVTERVFAALEFDNEYFKSIQYDTFLHCLMLMSSAGIVPTPRRVIDCLKGEKHLAHLANSIEDVRLRQWVSDFLSLKREEREQRTSGLVAQLQNFAVGETASIFNNEVSDISLDSVMDLNQIVYCQLPALKIPTLGKATGKMVLQCLQSAVSSRHLGRSMNRTFFSVYLDDFTEYLTGSFTTLLNKSRSANVGIVFSHQALGDLDGLGDGIKNIILTNSNLKVFMRTNEPESAEYFSSLIGTVLTQKVTERQIQGLFGSNKTGDGSVRQAEEFKFHPNIFKQELGVGQAVMVLPHENGSLPLMVKLQMCPDLERVPIPSVAKGEPIGMTTQLSSSRNNSIEKFLAKNELKKKEAG